MNRTRWMPIVAVVVLVVGWLGGCSLAPTQPVPTFVPRTTPTPQAGEIYAVVRGTLSQAVEARGRVVASQEEFLFFPLEGFVKTLDIQAGDPVQAGQVVAELDAAAIEDLLLDAEYRLQVAQADLARAKAVSETLQLQIDGLDIQIQQQQAADTYGVATAQGDLKVASADVDTCKAQLSGYEKATAQAETDVRRAQIAFEAVRYVWAGEKEEKEKQQQQQPPAGEEKVEVAIPPAGYSSAVAALEAATLKLEQNKAAIAAQKAECEGRNADVSLKRTELKYQTQIQGLEVQRLEAEIHRLEKEKEINALTIQTVEEEVRYRQTMAERNQQRLAQTQLKAPFDGVIVSVEKRAGEQLKPYEPLGAIADPSVFRVEATVLEEDILKVALGQPASVTLDAYAAQPFQATVTEIGASPVVWQGKNAYTIYLDFAQPDEAPASIRMGADVRIQVTERADVLLVPETAIARQGERSFVTKRNGDGSLEQVEVELGVSDGQWVEVVAGLSEGQEIEIP